MNFETLHHFVQHKMRMSHIYQPVMIKCLLEKRGNATDKEIAEQLLQYDPSQVEYYQKITNQMVGKVLRNHEIVTKERNRYSLADFESLSKGEIDTLVRLCETKLDEYVTKRGEAIWQHRKNNREYISGTVRYEVLKRAGFHCELCGVSANIRALEVDHIEPVNKGGKNLIDNYQALCYSCNAMKRDTDNTNFNKRNEQHAHREVGCLFCETDNKVIVEENELAYCMFDGFPVTPQHCLIIPKRHVSSYFDISQSELNAISRLTQQARETIQQLDSSVLGFNIGVNVGADAGQTIFHSHVHIIPRRKGDVEIPIGGVRNIIPGKGSY
jgi:ATP adenylyltransferase